MKALEKKKEENPHKDRKLIAHALIYRIRILTFFS